MHSRKFYCKCNNESDNGSSQIWKRTSYTNLFIYMYFRKCMIWVRNNNNILCFWRGWWVGDRPCSLSTEGWAIVMFFLLCFEHTLSLNFVSIFRSYCCCIDVIHEIIVRGCTHSFSWLKKEENMNVREVIKVEYINSEFWSFMESHFKDAAIIPNEAN